MLAQPPRRAREDLERPRDVEDLRVREADHHDAVRAAGGGMEGILRHVSHLDAIVARTTRTGSDIRARFCDATPAGAGAS
jgi:hypothetical protein